ncbi:MAG: hypothetical protein VX498_05955, partial [Myxococcota bacterium]|nr:hypothetical protein [Myxococcota bacterium]
VDALLETLTNDDAVGQDFNLGNPMNTLTIYDLAKRTIRLADSKSELIFQHIDYSDIDIRVPRTVKARNVLGWKPRFEIDEAIVQTLDWYRENLDAFRDRFKED